MADEPKAIFLTGASGYVASAFRRVAAKDPRLCTISVRRDEVPNFKKFEVNAGRMSVIHFAWPDLSSASGVAAGDGERVWKDYLAWSKRIKQACAAAEVDFVGIGSGLELFAGDERMKEPYQSYARRKIELRTALGETDGADHRWIRLHFMFGPGERVSRVVPAAIIACQKGETLTCGSLARRRRWLHVDDQARYLAEFLLRPGSGEWDIAGRADVSFRELLSLVETAMGRPLAVIESKERTPDDELATIAPVRMAPNVPDEAGTVDRLIERLRVYARSLVSPSSELLTQPQREG